MWTYAQKSGQLLHDGQLAGGGYSGFGEGKNNPQLQALHDVGPIPQGGWTINGPPFNSSQHGAYVLRLEPAATTETFGRSGFLMHGDSIALPGCASRGCIVMPRDVREQVWESGDRDLEVMAEFAIDDLMEDAGHETS
jgi:hypothetical protein